MHDLSDWNRLDAASFRVSMKRSVRRFAWIGVAAGAIIGTSGWLAAFIPLVAIAMTLLCAGAWNLCRPSITGLIVDGVAMILTGAFNCLAWLWLEDARATAVGRWIFAGVVQIVWGVRRVALYATARSTPNDPQAIARLEAVVGELSKRDAKEDATVVEFRTGGLRKQRNRIGLYAEGAVALVDTAARLEKRGDITIEPRGTIWHGRSVKVAIQLSDLELAGEMTAEHLERFERWKLGMAQSRSIAA